MFTARYELGLVFVFKGLRSIQSISEFMTNSMTKLIYGGITLQNLRVSVYTAFVTLNTLTFVHIVYLCVACDS